MCVLYVSHVATYVDVVNMVIHVVMCLEGARLIEFSHSEINSGRPNGYRLLKTSGIGKHVVQ